MSAEDELRSPPIGYNSAGEDATLSCVEQASCHEQGRRNRAHSLQSRTPVPDFSRHEEIGKSTFLTTLMNAEAAANAAAIQLVSFKDAVEDDCIDSRQSGLGKQLIKRQRGLLLDKLEDFRRTNKLVRQKLKQFQDSEAERLNANQQIDILLRKVSQAESENEHFKRDLSLTERQVEELMELRREEHENMKSAVHLTKSVDATRAHLQWQLHNKEAENNRLTVHMRTLERTLTEQKMEADDLKSCITSLTEKAAQDKVSLKKAARAQKQRAERFEAAVEKCYAQLKEKDEQLANTHSEKHSRKRQTEQMTEEKRKLVAHIELLKSQIAELTAPLQRGEDELTAANGTVMQCVEKLSVENGDLNINNAALKASVTKLEQQLAECGSALLNADVVSRERKNQAEQCQHQVAALQTEIEDLRIKYANVLRKTERIQDGKETEVEKVRQELKGRVEELKPYPELLSAAEQSLTECQENQLHFERICSEQSETISHQQVKMDTLKKSLRSTVEMRESIHEVNLQLQEKVNSLNKQMDKLREENLDMVQKLAAQDEALSNSNKQLDQCSSECQALNRQLEAAISDVEQQVNKVKVNAASREEGLHFKILELESEKRRKDSEFNHLHHSKHISDKQFEVRLKDMQVSLDQSQSHKQSIQNYIDFLKNSFNTVFDEKLQTSTSYS